MPERQVVGPETVYPALQAGWQELPLASILLVQVPAIPFCGAIGRVQVSGLHVAAVKVVPLQDVRPEIVNPELHTG